MLTLKIGNLLLSLLLLHVLNNITESDALQHLLMLLLLGKRLVRLTGLGLLLSRLLIGLLVRGKSIKALRLLFLIVFVKQILYLAFVGELRPNLLLGFLLLLVGVQLVVWADIRGFLVRHSRLEDTVHKLLLLAFLTWNGCSSRSHNGLGLSLRHLIHSVLDNGHDLVVHKLLLASGGLLESEKAADVHLLHH